jgi:WD40 repeat protein/serine/threonine protein kinase
MRICHACQRELDPAAIVKGKCPHCGVTLRKISQRTIDDTRLRNGGETPQVELILDESEDSIDLEGAAENQRTTDTDQGGATIELQSFYNLDQYRDEPASSEPSSAQTIDSAELSAAEAAAAGAAEPPKTPTIHDRSDMTMEFPTIPSGEPPAKPTRRSTHSLESDKTIDLAMSPAEARQLDSQWRETVDPDARQGQTIRQRETVTGFRSSLPVKSRFVRDKRKSGDQPPKSLAEVPDYELLDIIGEGGMGVVYAAHQSSIARTVAVKMLKPSAKIREEQRDKFISEAVVTGELDHPNIVPIYDLGSNDEGALFYSMKRVRGTPWDKVINQKQLDENLSILLRVADAVAFAHAGGVIHRDLKPENVMLGDYGEVLVMDWGLARITPEFAHVDAVYQADSLGGTPAYMAPEMAKGPVEAINKTSDVYLLGAILYEIIGGEPPHSGRDVMQCLMAASQNRIDAIRYDGELKEIALKAMATHQEDRYQTVKEFQEAVRVYQSHSESLVLSAHANQNLQKARVSKDYQVFARALYGFQEALTLWDGNHRAKMLLAETQHDYAATALEKGDLDLGASLLQPENASHEALLKQIDKARAERNARQRRLRMAKQAVAALLLLVVTTITIAFFSVRAQRNKAVVAQQNEATQRQIAESNEQEAKTQRAEAEKQTDIAQTQEKEANRQAGIARTQETEAKRQAEIARQEEAKATAAKQAEEYEAYIAQIGLANAKINDNAYDFALELLKGAKPELRNWEWGRLAHLSQLGTATYKLGGPVDAIAYSPDGKSIASGDMTGTLVIRDAATGNGILSHGCGQYVFSLAYSPNGQYIAVGTNKGDIQILDVSPDGLRKKDIQVQTLRGHTDGVLSVRFSPDGRQLLSGSYDNTARLWDVATGAELQSLKGHSWWVWSAEFSPDGNRIVTAGQDGKAIVWQRGAVGSQLSAIGQNQTNGRPADGRQPTADSRVFTPLTEFTGHNGAVYSARFSPNGKRVATGGYDKLVLVWNPDEVKPIDIGKRLDGQPDTNQSVVRLAGHDGPVRSVAFSPNGKLALSGGEDNTIRVWDLATGESVKALRGHGSSVRSCVFSPDGQLVLSGGDDESVRVWNVQGYQEVRVLHATVFSGHEDAVLSARFSRDGKHIVTASRDRTASLWNAETGQPLRRFQEGHEFLVSGAVFYPDGRHLATGAGDNSVRVWDLTAGTQTAMMTPTGRIGTLAVSPDGKWLASGSIGSAIKLWNAATGEALGSLTGHDAEISALRFSPRGNQLASGDSRGHVRLWKLEPQAAAPNGGRWEFDRELIGHNASINAMRYTPDGQRLLTASGDHTCAQWDLASGEELRQLVLKHDEWVSSLDVSPDGKFAITTCDDGAARLWQLADAKPIAIAKSASRPFNSVGFSPDGDSAVLSSSEDKAVRLWNLSPAISGAAADAARAGSTELVLDFNKSGGEVWAAMFAPDGQHVLTIGGNDAELWNLGTRRPVIRYSPHGAVASAAVSPDGKFVATGSWDHSAKIWDIATGHALRKLEGGHAGYINSVEFSPDGKELLTASDDGTGRLWDVASGKPTGVVFKGHTARILSATFSPDGLRVLTVSGDKTARLWERGTGQQIGEPFVGHKWAILCGGFSQDGKRIVTGSQDKTAIVWDVDSRNKLMTLEGHTASVTSVAFSPDGSRAVTGSQDNSAKLWDAATGKEILSLPGHTQEVTSVSFSPDGRNLLTSSRDGTAIIWLASEWRGEAGKTALSAR